MRTLFDAASRAALLGRLDALRPDARPCWGRMSAPEMLCHQEDAFRFALGELETQPLRSPFAWRPLAWLTIHVLPWPKGRAQAPPELVGRTAEDGDWPRLVAVVKDQVERFAARGPDAAWPRHPNFGRLTGRDFGVLFHRHLDHHLTQFGV